MVQAAVRTKNQTTDHQDASNRELKAIQSIQVSSNSALTYSSPTASSGTAAHQRRRTGARQEDVAMPE